MQRLRDEINETRTQMRNLVHVLDESGEITKDEDNKPIMRTEWDEESQTKWNALEAELADKERKLQGYQTSLERAAQVNQQAESVGRFQENQGIRSTDEAHATLQDKLMDAGIAATFFSLKNENERRAYFAGQGISTERVNAAYKFEPDADGGYTIPEEVADFILTKPQAIGGFEDFANHVNVEGNSRDFTQPTEDLTSQKGRGRAEDPDDVANTPLNAGIPEIDPTLGELKMSVGLITTEITSYTERFMMSTGVADFVSYVVNAKQDALRRTRAELFMPGKANITNGSDIPDENRGALQDAQNAVDVVATKRDFEYDTLAELLLTKPETACSTRHPSS